MIACITNLQCYSDNVAQGVCEWCYLSLPGAQSKFSKPTNLFTLIKHTSYLTFLQEIYLFNNVFATNLSLVTSCFNMTNINEV